MTKRADILDTALQLGQQCGWENLRLGQIAGALDMSLADIYRHFSQKDALVDAWFDRADQTLLSVRPPQSWLALPPSQRLEDVIWRWLQALSGYRLLTGQMLLYKLEPGHVHLQLGGILRISRTVQWLMEAADLRARHLARIQQEVALSALFVTTFIHWLNDPSARQQQCRMRLNRRLAAGARIKFWK